MVWQTTRDRQIRFAMLDDLRQRYLVIGKTRQEIDQLLGKPDQVIENEEEAGDTGKGFIRYDMGAVGGDSETALEIHFEHGRVDKIEVYRNT